MGRRRQHIPAEAVVGPLGVVELQPGRGDLTHLGEGGEAPGIEHFVPVGTVEALDAGVLIRLAVLTKAGADVVLLEAGGMWDNTRDSAMFKWAHESPRRAGADREPPTKPGHAQRPVQH